MECRGFESLHTPSEMKRFVALVLFTWSSSFALALTVARLKCEYWTDPQGIDVAQPHLSWTVESDERGARQTSYQILIASTADLLSDDKGDLWDTGRIASDDTLNVAYRGKAAALLATRVLEDPRVGHDRPRFAVERCQHVDDGAARSEGLESEMDICRRRRAVCDSVSGSSTARF